MVDDSQIPSPVSERTGRIGFAPGPFLWIVAFAIWTEGSQLEARALDAHPSEAAIPEDVAPPDPNAPNEKVSLAAVERDIRTDPSKAPDVVQAALWMSVADPIIFAGQVVEIAIHTLLRPITRAQISALILAAVKARPAAVLAIVRVAVRGTPHYLHRDIVAAAVAGVPDPYRRDAQGKTLTESILDAAVKAGSCEMLDELLAAINSSLGNIASPVNPLVGTSGNAWSEGYVDGNAPGGGLGGAGGGGLGGVGGGGFGGAGGGGNLAAPTPFPAPRPTPDPTPFPEPTATPVPVSP